MILTKEVEVTINPLNFKRLKDIGYKFDHVGDKIEININDLSKGSNVKIEVKCEHCKKTKFIAYYNYLNQIKKGDNKYYCSDCKLIKSGKTLIKKYGVDNASKLDFVKDKKIKTTIENYGVEHTFQSDININKRIKTLIEKYGVEHNSQIDFVKIKKKQLPDQLLDDWKLFRRLVRRYTKRNKNELFQNWDGYDYYDGEYIKDNFFYSGINGFYPSIDHKISIFYGFINGYTPEFISSLENLCITKRKINSSKNIKIETDYKNNN